VLELAFHAVVVDVVRREAAAAVFEQRVAGEGATVQRLFAVAGHVQSVAVCLVCDVELFVVDDVRPVVPVRQTDAQPVPVLISQQMNHVVPKPVFTINV